MSAPELEIKAVVDDPAELACRLRAGGATEAFRGLMRDRRYDLPGGTLAARDELLRIRSFVPAAGAAGRPAEVAWKGPTRRHGGYKSREEYQVEVAEPAVVETILARLGFAPTDAVDRCVECFAVEGAAARIEWYPRMDVLVEIEGEPAAIEAAVRVSGLPRARFSSDRLADFAARYAARTGAAPALGLGTAGADRASWPAWAP